MLHCCMIWFVRKKQQSLLFRKERNKTTIISCIPGMTQIPALFLMRCQMLLALERHRKQDASCFLKSKINLISLLRFALQISITDTYVYFPMHLLGHLSPSIYSCSSHFFSTFRSGKNIQCHNWQKHQYFLFTFILIQKYSVYVKSHFCSNLFVKVTDK